eukprot:GHVS01089835.1.p1 GENE.GHVS01089835.1~~GHVS01089835.1.p1  ORF type:complete len:247 (+),score=50.18 GHVS01089835.1:739-1479(+)
MMVGTKSFVCLVAVSLFLCSIVNGQALRSLGLEEALKGPEDFDIATVTNLIEGLKELLLTDALKSFGTKKTTTTTAAAVTPATTATTTSATTSATTTAAATAPSVCPGTITVNYGTEESSQSNVAKKVPMKKLMALNPSLFGLCNDMSTVQCSFGYVFPLGIVFGVDGEQAISAVMMYVLTTQTWALYKSTLGESPVSYSASLDVGLSSPAEAISYPWLTGPAAVTTAGQTVQGIACGGKFKVAKT